MPRLTLTFDNGPHPGSTEAILGILAARGLKAIFFLIGERLRVPICRRTAETAHAAGHWIGNHTMHHRRALGHEPGRRGAAEIAEAQAMLGALAHPDKLFRPIGDGKLGPHLLSRAAADYLVAERFSMVTWNNIPGDWHVDGNRWAERALDRLGELDWSVLVIHDDELIRMMHTLPAFLDEAARRGAEFVQEIPPECMPLHRGAARPEFESYVT